MSADSAGQKPRPVAGLLLQIGRSQCPEAA